jgi:DNA/RNA endonuclease G (NUC1)
MGKNKQTTIIKTREMLQEKNQKIWGKIEKLARRINRLNRKKISAVKILLKEREGKY